MNAQPDRELVELVTQFKPTRNYGAFPEGKAFVYYEGSIEYLHISHLQLHLDDTSGKYEVRYMFLFRDYVALKPFKTAKEAYEYGLVELTESMKSCEREAEISAIANSIEASILRFTDNPDHHSDRLFIKVFGVDCHYKYSIAELEFTLYTYYPGTAHPLTVHELDHVTRHMKILMAGLRKSAKTNN